MIFYEIKHKKTHVDVDVRKDGSVNVNVNVGGMTPDASCYKHTIYVTAHLNSVTMQAALPHVFEALRHYYPYAEYCLELPYLPYARQDRRCNPGESAGAKVFANQINALGCKAVVITDPHSEVIAQLINGAQVADQAEVFGHLNFADYIIVAPDLGALKKAEKFAEHTGARGVIAFHKVRDMSTGEIVSHKMINTSGVRLVAQDKFLVLDDICDGGRTFVGVAEQLRDALPSPIRLELAVTHGIFSYGQEVVTDVYDKVYTTNSFIPDLESNEKLTVVDFFK
ncbi:ribose-phosphate pyrophosphokinase [Pseudomonas phage vB_PpuM-Amme-3]|uniref:Ribose-phosphate pyrophosphokinase n=1 Tax=Pseudomonas phage vB_PpuM-Amme-3 TaxID=3132617 RepID=A0AAX4MYJ5_9CAUD